MALGKIKWYNEVKGFGFIESDEGKDIFVHRSGFYDTDYGIEPEQKVEFEIKHGNKGPYAANVKSIEH